MRGTKGTRMGMGGTRSTRGAELVRRCMKGTRIVRDTRLQEVWGYEWFEVGDDRLKVQRI